MKKPWILRALALVGFLVCAYLFFRKAAGDIDSIEGCGAESGCANALGSRWSQFFGIPVSFLAAVMYLALLVATWRPSRQVYVAFAICFVGAATWFVNLLVFEVKAFCPWCTAMHLIGVSSAVVLFLSLRKLEPASPSPFKFAPLGAILALIVLCLGQVFGPTPDTHAEETGISIDERGTPDALGKGKSGNQPGSQGRSISLPNGSKNFHTGLMPHLGSANAPHVIVKYFDYTCASCRDMHEDLHLVAKNHPGKFCMIMLPVPLNRACNPHFPTQIENHEHACELARLGLAAWRAKPEAFPEVHETLFTRPVMDPEIAEIAVAQIVGEEELAKALKDPWVDDLLKADLNDFSQLIRTTIKMPKLLVLPNGKLLHGLMKSPEILLRELEKEFKLPPNP